MKKPTDTYIVINIELPCKCNQEDFKRIYQENYRAAITNEFIRSNLDGFEVIGLKRNGTFGRKLELLDLSNNLYIVEVRIQTTLWKDITGEIHYLSIFPNFIRKYTRPSLTTLEYISCKTKKEEDVFLHIDDKNNIHSCEDRLVYTLKALDNKCNKENYENLLKVKYGYNSSISSAVLNNEVDKSRFPHIHALIVIMEKSSMMHLNNLSFAYSVLRF